MAAQGLIRYHRLPTRPDRITVPAQKHIQTRYSAGLSSELPEPKSPVMSVVSKPATPINPPTTRGTEERAIGTSDGMGRRGYSSAFDPTWSPATKTTNTNETSTTPPAAKRYSASEIGRS